MIISERIFALLEQKGISQKEFSQLTGISQSTISDWKRKKTNPASDKIMNICDVLRISPYDLLSGADGDGRRELDYIMIDKDSRDYTIIEKLRARDDSFSERVLGYIEALEAVDREKK